MEHKDDVIIIGAGMAGLSAARALAEAGKAVLVIEASPRVGGRILSARLATGEGTVELGAEFVHGAPQATLSLAREAGIELIRLDDAHFVKRAGKLVKTGAPWLPLARVMKKLEPGQVDLTAAAFLAQCDEDSETREQFRQLVEGFEAAPVSEVSIRSLATDSDAIAQDDQQFWLAGSYGRLAEHQCERALSAGARLQLSTRATRITWRENGPTTVSVDRTGTKLSARACIVTAPVGVLQAPPEHGGLVFEPEITFWQAQLARLGMGHVSRIVFEFEGSLLAPGVPYGVIVHQPSDLFETFWCRATPGATLWVAWSGGPKARKIATEAPARREEAALEALASLLDQPREKLTERLKAVHAHDFSNDPFTRGAYSFCRPDGAKAWQALQAPFANTLLLAGEAIDGDYPGTVAGAIESGKRAAERALAML